MSSPDQRVILVTGANKGIGFEAVRLLSEQLPQATILLGTRSAANAEAALVKLRQANPSSSYGNIHPLVIDVTDKATIVSAAQHVKAKHGHLDVLVNNAGVSNVDGQSVHQGVMDVNLYGVKDAIEAFLPLLPPSSSSLITVSSEVGSWATHACSAELQRTLLEPSTLTWSTIDSLAQQVVKPTASSRWPPASDTFGAYGPSKALVSAYMRTVALQHPELKVAIVCPGYCATDLNHHSGHRSAAQGGESVIFPVTHSFESGHFYQDGKELPWSFAAPSWLKK